MLPASVGVLGQGVRPVLGDGGRVGRRWVDRGEDLGDHWPDPRVGPAGNVEYFLHLRRGADPLDDADLARAIEEGPQ